MANRVQGLPAVNGKIVSAHAADISTAGVKLTYTCPTGMQAQVRQITCFQISAGGSLAPFVTVGGVKTQLGTGQTTYSLQTYLCLNAGDTCTLETTATGAGATSDLTISAEEFPAT